MTLSLSIASTAILSTADLTARARLPSGVIATAETLSAPVPIVTVSVTLTSLPAIDSTEIDPSSRLQTSASVPAALIARPDGFLPSVRVAMTAGGLAFRSMTNSRLSETVVKLPSLGTPLTELATKARSRDGVIARLVGGPTIVLSSGIVATIRSAAGFDMSMIDSVSCPPSCGVGLPFSKVIFSSLPTIIN